MKRGMLWFDDNQKSSLTTKIEQAVNYYFNKYGLKPSCCLIHPSTLNGVENLQNHGLPLKVETVTYILPNYFWVGIE